jgi:hypothetical protein
MAIEPASAASDIVPVRRRSGTISTLPTLFSSVSGPLDWRVTSSVVSPSHCGSARRVSLDARVNAATMRTIAVAGSLYGSAAIVAVPDSAARPLSFRQIRSASSSLLSPRGISRNTFLAAMVSGDACAVPRLAIVPLRETSPPLTWP